MARTRRISAPPGGERSLPCSCRHRNADKEMARRTDQNRQTIRQVVRGGGARTDAFRSRMSSLEPYLARLDADWSAGCHDGGGAVAASQSRWL